MLALLAGLIVSYLLGAIYSLGINPEIRFWKEAYRQKIEWAKRLSLSEKPKMVFIGGSSTAFQIDAGLLTSSGLPTVNMGMHAGMGTKANAAFGLQAVRPGDTVIWAFEKGRMAAPPEITDLGYQALLSTGLLFQPGIESLALGHIDWIQAIESLRPGLAHTASMIAKLIHGGYLYRYQTKLIREGGSITTDERRPVSKAEIKQMYPSDMTMEWIGMMSAALNSQDSSSAYLIPQEFYQPVDKEAGQMQNRVFLDELSQTLKIVNDSFLGVQTDAACFADTTSHLTEEARKERTHGLIPLLTPFLKIKKQ